MDCALVTSIIWQWFPRHAVRLQPLRHGRPVAVHDHPELDLLQRKLLLPAIENLAQALPYSKEVYDRQPLRAAAFARRFVPPLPDQV